MLEKIIWDFFEQSFLLSRSDLQGCVESFCLEHSEFDSDEILEGVDHLWYLYTTEQLTK